MTARRLFPASVAGESAGVICSLTRLSASRAPWQLSPWACARDGRRMAAMTTMSEQLRMLPRLAMSGAGSGGQPSADQMLDGGSVLLATVMQLDGVAGKVELIAGRL